MDNICSWCTCDMGTVPVESTLKNALTHGICKECLETFFRPQQVRFLDFIDGINVAVVVIDANGSVANKQARVHLQKELPDRDGFKCGDVFECASATLPGGCGNTTHCDGCTIRFTVMNTFETGMSHLKKPIYRVNGIPDENQEIQFFVSTVKVRDVVLLKIDTF
jgi:hypothetical protein